MRLRVCVPKVEPTVMDAPDVCPYPECDGRYFKNHQQRCDKPLRDTKCSRVNAMRWKCLRCGRTYRVYPKGVSQAHHSDRLKGLATLFYLLGLSYGGVEDALVALECPLSKTSVYRDVQAAGENVRELRQTWLQQQAGKVRIVGGDPTHVRCSGKDVVVGVVVDDERGITLDIVLLENERTETLKTWLLPMLERVGAQVLTTDDANGFKEVADEAGVRHQICRRHVTTNVLTFIAETAQQVWENPPAVPEELTLSLDHLLADLELLEWIMLGHPGHGARLLEELYLRYAHAPAPKKAEHATLWYRMRNHILHLWDNWSRLTCYLTLRHSEGLEINPTNNAAERAIGWAVKDRYRTMRGYKRQPSILNVTSLTAWLLEQRVGYNMSPLFAA
jgi:transposase-like protein